MTDYRKLNDIMFGWPRMALYSSHFFFKLVKQLKSWKDKEKQMCKQAHRQTLTSERARLAPYEWKTG